MSQVAATPAMGVGHELATLRTKLERAQRSVLRRHLRNHPEPLFSASPYAVCFSCGETWRVAWYDDALLCEDCLATRLGGYVYLACIGEPKDADRIKIGWSSNPWFRIDALRREFGPDLDFYGWFPGTRNDERTVHGWFADHRIEREWFEFAPVATWFRRFDGRAPVHVGVMVPPA